MAGREKVVLCLELVGNGIRAKGVMQTMSIRGGRLETPIGTASHTNKEQKGIGEKCAGKAAAQPERMTGTP